MIVFDEYIPYYPPVPDSQIPTYISIFKQLAHKSANELISRLSYNNILDIMYLSNSYSGGDFTGCTIRSIYSYDIPNILKLSLRYFSITSDECVIESKTVNDICLESKNKYLKRMRFLTPFLIKLILSSDDTELPNNLLINIPHLRILSISMPYMERNLPEDAFKNIVLLSELILYGVNLDVSNHFRDLKNLEYIKIDHCKGKILIGTNTFHNVEIIKDFTIINSNGLEVSVDASSECATKLKIVYN